MKRLMMAAIVAVACSNPTAPPARLHFASTLAASKCTNGKYALTADWQAPTKWRAIYIVLKDTVKQSSPFADGPKTSTCAYTAGKSAYAILDAGAVGTDNDMTPTIVVK